MNLETALGHDRWLYHLPRPARIRYRQSWLTELSRGKRVIHMGFTDYGCEGHRAADATWLHARIAHEAAHVVGLDIDQETVARAASRGFDVAVVDCTDVEAVNELGLEPADLVIVGELIEHVDNPVALLRSAGHLMRPTGEVVITTPNANRLQTIILAAAKREVVHPDHLMTFTPRLLFETARRGGLQPRELMTYRGDLEPDLMRSVISHTRHRGPRPAIHSVIAHMIRLIARPFPYLDPGLILLCDSPSNGAMGSTKIRP